MKYMKLPSRRGQGDGTTARDTLFCSSALLVVLQIQRLAGPERKVLRTERTSGG